MSNFQYRPRTEADWTKRAEGNIFDSFVLDKYKTFSPKKENNIRILPPTWDNPRHYGFDIYLHYSVGPNNGTVLCPFKMKGQKCPICEVFASKTAKGEEDANTYKPTRRVLVWILDRKDDKATEPILWSMPQTVDQGITKICKDRSSGELYQIDHPELGYDVYFDKDGEGMLTKYAGYQLSKRTTTVDDKDLTFITNNPVPSTLLWRNADEILAILGGEIVPAEKAGETKPQFETKLSSVSISETTAPIPAQVASAPPPVFVAAWLESECSICKQKQYTTPDGWTCQNGHANAAPFVAQATPPPPVVVVAPPPPSTAPAPPSATANRAQELKNQFVTGK